MTIGFYPTGNKVLLATDKNSGVNLKIEIDATLSFSPTTEYAISKHVISDGALRVNHKDKRPLKIEITGFFTDTPTSLLNPLIQIEGKRDRSQEKIEELGLLAQYTLTVVDEPAIYKNMQITKLTSTRSTSGGYQRDFVLELEELKYSTTNGSTSMDFDPNLSLLLAKRQTMGNIATTAFIASNLASLLQ